MEIERRAPVFKEEKLLQFYIVHLCSYSLFPNSGEGHIHMAPHGPPGYCSRGEELALVNRRKLTQDFNCHRAKARKNALLLRRAIGQS